MTLSFRKMALLALAALTCLGNTEVRHEHFSPAGKGPPLVMISGAFGEGAYRALARRMAALGYDVLLIDSRDLVDIEEAGIKAVIEHARSSDHATSQKVAMIGFSLGGGQLLAYASTRPDQVGAIVAMYPATSLLGEPSALAERIKVPVLLLAGEEDRLGNCCAIETARAIASAAQSRKAPLELTAFPRTGHGFAMEGTEGYNRRVAERAWAQALAWFQRHGAGPPRAAERAPTSSR